MTEPASDRRPHGDPTMMGTCRIHRGAEVSMHYDGRSYVCSLCAIERFEAGTYTPPRYTAPKVTPVPEARPDWDDSPGALDAFLALFCDD